MAHVETYRLRDGSKRYRARWIDAGGRERSRTFDLKKDADRFVLEQKRRASLGALYQAPPETLGEFAAGWLDRYALRVRPSSLHRARDLMQHLDVFGSVPLDEIRPAAVEDHIADLAKRAPRQAELTLRVLKQVLASAKERGHLVDEAVFRVTAPRREAREMRFPRLGRSRGARREHHRDLREHGHACRAHGSAPGRAVRAARSQPRPRGEDGDRRERHLRRRARAGEDACLTPSRGPLRHCRPRPPSTAARAQAE